MINRLSHTTIWVTDQDQALEFYVGKLGFEKATDQTIGDFRWVTVRPPAQTDLELVLMPVGAGPMMDEATTRQMRELLAKGVLGAGVFNVDDCKKSYDALVARGVEFTAPPQERPYGIEAMMKDPFGNYFSMTQRPK